MDDLPDEPRSRRDRARSHALHAYDLIRLRLHTAEVALDVKFVEHSMISTLGLSRNAVRHAAQQLTDAGILTREVREGTRLSGQRFELDLTRLGEDLAPLTVSETERSTVQASLGLRDLFGETHELRFCEQVFRHDREPIALRRSYFRPDHESDARLSSSTSDPDVFERVYRSAPGKIDSVIDVRDADEHLRVRLALGESTRILTVLQTLSDASGTVVEQVFWHFRGDRVSLRHSAATAP